MTDAPGPPGPYPGRLIIKYLQENKDGATAPDILHHVQEQNGTKSSEDLQKAVEYVLANGTTLGFLERKGSLFMNWVARELCGQQRRRRKSRCGRRRRRKRSCRRRRRRKRKCRC